LQILAASRECLESLQSLAVDIARMVDHETAADLCERYKRGERGAGSALAKGKRRLTKSAANIAATPSQV
jgi:hypothetical protein